MEMVELGSILHMEKGKKPKDQTKDKAEGYLPYVDIKAFEQGIVDNYATVEKSLLCEDGDLLIVCDGSRSGLTGKAIKGVVGSTLSKIYADGLTTEYLRYFIQSKYVLLNTKKKGTGTPHLNVNILKSSKLVVPPEDKQLEVVQKIEELFSSLDNAVETLNKTKEQLAVYRQAVLKMVFENVTDSTDMLVNDVCDEIKVGIVIKPSKYYTTENKGVKAFRSANVREFHIDDFDWVYLSEEGQQENQRSIVHTGDVLIVRSGYPGTACVVTDKYDGCNAIDVLIAVPNKKKVMPEYLCAFTNSPRGKMFVEEKKRGVGQKHFNVGGYKKMMIPIPSLAEQRRIVEMIDDRLSVCQKISEIVDDGLLQAAALRQSILKEAFEGRLV